MRRFLLQAVLALLTLGGFVVDAAARAQAEPIYSYESPCTPDEGDRQLGFDFRLYLSPPIIQFEPLPNSQHILELDLVTSGAREISHCCDGLAESGKATAILLTCAAGKPPLVSLLWAREGTRAPKPPA